MFALLFAVNVIPIYFLHQEALAARPLEIIFWGVLIFLAFARGRLIGHPWLAALPVIAAAILSIVPGPSLALARIAALALAICLCCGLLRQACAPPADAGGARHDRAARGRQRWASASAASSRSTASTLSVEAGERVGLIGPNGSGKSTLVNCICGTLTNETGNVHFDGADHERPERAPAHARAGLRAASSCRGRSPA